MRTKGKGGCSLLLFSFSLFLFPALGARPAEDAPWTVLLSGDADGYLSPCGCTSPMQGGIRRRATALHEDGRVVRLDNGSLSNGLDRQNVLKAETGARALDSSKIDGANFVAKDARLGTGAALSLVRLSGGRMLSTSLRPSATVPMQPWRASGPFLIGGATASPDILAAGLRESTLRPEEAAHRLVEEATAQRLAPVLLFDGDRVAAGAIARAEPSLRLVTYRSTGHPFSKLDREGSCALATPGERGKSVIRLVWGGDAFVSTAVEDLGPNVPDDPDAKDLYAAYLRDVTRYGLLEKAPHVGDKKLTAFSGTARCVTCHASAGMVWKATGHAHALRTLERDGHGRDPECVPCHVVGESHFGAEPTMAFRSRPETPHLADVGCESCHGAGASHSASPLKSRLPRVGASACKPCHSLENSPNFVFEKYWPKVRHGR